MPQFEPHHKKLEGSGRKPGQKAQNQELRDLIRNFTRENWDTFVARMATLDDKEYCQLFEKLLKYVLPTISSVRFEQENAINGAVALLQRFAEYRKSD